MNQLTKKEQEIIRLMRIKREGRTSVYDVIIFGDNTAVQKEMLNELRWQMQNGPGEDMANDYGWEICDLIALSIIKP